MTFTLVARTGDYIGIATATLSLAVGAIVPALRPGVGAVATQAHTNRAFRHIALDTLEGGLNADQTLQHLAQTDADFDLRQVAVLPSQGIPAAHTGERTTPWRGHHIGPDHIVLGNCLTGEDVLTAINAHWENTPEANSAHQFAVALVDALYAGDQAGGDKRGRQSAAVVVAARHAAVTNPVELLVDLRVDDHPTASLELQRIVHLA